MSARNRGEGLNQWRELILRNKINEFFNKQSNVKRLQLMKIINYLEDITYDYMERNLGTI